MADKSSLKGYGHGTFAVLTCATLLASSVTAGEAPKKNPSLAGTWTLVAADKEAADGTRTHDQYGDHPKGRLIIDAKGRYCVEIFQPDIANFAADEAGPTAEEYRNAMEGASVHFGQITPDWAHHTLRMAIDEALYPNLRGALQNRPFEYDGQVLTWRIPRNAEGIVRISVWRRDP